MFWCAYLLTNVVCAYVAKWVQICANHVTNKSQRIFSNLYNIDHEITVLTMGIQCTKASHRLKDKGLNIGIRCTIVTIPNGCTYPPPHLLGVEGKVCIVWGYDFSGEATQNHINMMFKRQLRRHSVYGLRRTRFAKPKCNYANQINIDKLLSNIIFYQILTNVT